MMGRRLMRTLNRRILRWLIIFNLLALTAAFADYATTRYCLSLMTECVDRVYKNGYSSHMEYNGVYIYEANGDIVSNSLFWALLLYSSVSILFAYIVKMSNQEHWRLHLFIWACFVFFTWLPAINNIAILLLATF